MSKHPSELAKNDERLGDTIELHVHINWGCNGINYTYYHHLEKDLSNKITVQFIF